MSQINIDNFSSYSKLAALTDDVSNKSYYENNAHYMYGFLTEITELQFCTDTVNRDEEIGDLFWYMARYIDQNGLNVEVTIDFYWDKPRENLYVEEVFTPTIRTLYQNLSEIVDIEKKWLAYGKKRDYDKIEAHLKLMIEGLHCITNKSFKQICEANIFKLRKRYGGKFDAYLAVNRNLDEERTLLEEKLL